VGSRYHELVHISTMWRTQLIVQLYTRYPATVTAARWLCIHIQTSLLRRQSQRPFQSAIPETARSRVEGHHLWRRRRRVCIVNQFVRRDWRRESDVFRSLPSSLFFDHCQEVSAVTYLVHDTTRSGTIKQNLYQISLQFHRHVGN